MLGTWFAELINGVYEPALASIEAICAALLLIWGIKKAYSALTGK